MRILLPLALVGCAAIDAARSDLPPPPSSNIRRALFVPINLNRDLDLLIVMDNSMSMGVAQGQITSGMPSLVTELGLIPGGLPNLHVGVVSTDLGAPGLESLPGCADSDLGNLRAPLSPCADLVGNFVSSTMGGNNFSGALEDALQCITPIGTTGCDVVQPLRAIQHALMNPGNGPFRRPTAHLGLVIFSNGDDCSAEDGFFDEPGGKFRCFSRGVTCDQPDPEAPGERTNCVANDASEDMLSVTAFADSLRESQSSVSVVAMVGDPGPVAVTAGPAVAGICDGGAEPAVRITSFLDAMAGQSEHQSICGLDGGANLARVGRAITRGMGANACLAGELDSDRSSVALELDCRVYWTPDGIAAGPDRIEIPQCDSAVAPCFTYKQDLVLCDSFPTGYTVEVDYGDLPTAAPAHLLVECVVD